MPAFIRVLPEQAIHDVGFVETPRKEVMVHLTESLMVCQLRKMALSNQMKMLPKAEA